VVSHLWRSEEFTIRAPCFDTDRDDRQRSGRGVPNLRGADRSNASENDRDPCWKPTNEKKKMNSWRLYPFRMENIHQMENSLSIWGELLFPNIFPSIEGLVTGSTPKVTILFPLQSQCCQLESVLSFRHPSDLSQVTCDLPSYRDVLRRVILF
jgi:hypothetical protein